MVLANKYYHQRSVTIMEKGVLSLKYENEKTNTEMTSWTGLPVYQHLAGAIWLNKSIGKHLYRFPELCSEIWNCGISGCRKKCRDIETFFSQPL